MTDTMVVDVSQDWAAACDVQQRFMHNGVPTIDGISYSARCRQLRALGGDCYDFLPLPPNHLAFTIADASGKSLPAALVITNVQSSLRTAACFVGKDPAAVLGAVNRQLYTASLADRFATLFYGVFDTTTHRLRYASAGHNPPMVMRRDGSISWLNNASLPLGISADSMYEVGILHLHPGDTVIAYTDGVIEAVNPSGEEWGVDGLKKAIVDHKEQHTDELVDVIFTSLDEFSRGRQTDDGTLMVLSVH